MHVYEDTCRRVTQEMHLITIKLITSHQLDGMLNYHNISARYFVNLSHSDAPQESSGIFLGLEHSGITREYSYVRTLAHIINTCNIRNFYE
jgi:hypothetical protein